MSSEKPKTVKLTIDGRPVEVGADVNLIEAAREAMALEIPHYCYHPGLPVAGNCRMCLVEVEKAPKLQIACNTAAAEGMVVHTRSPRVIRAQRAVMEFLLINHPLDCPICDQAGECKLQDYYMLYDKVASRFPAGEKVHKPKVVDWNHMVKFDAERCILCTRCVRFMDHVADRPEIALVNRGDRTELKVYPGPELTSPYSGNIVDICPVGALTSKDFRFKKRVWFLRSAATVCPGCSNGCNISLQYERETAYRIQPRFNAEVNRWWLCDAGRLSYKFVNQERLIQPLVGRDGRQMPLEWPEAMGEAGQQLSEILSAHGGESCGVWASPHLTNEENYQIVRLAREAIRTPHLAFRLASDLQGEDDGFLIRADKTPNATGAAHMGAISGPGGMDGEKMIAAFRDGKLKAVVVFERDLIGTCGGIDAFKRGLEHTLLIYTGSNANDTSRAADVVLPLATFAEKEGTFTSATGRVQWLNRAFAPIGQSKTGLEIAHLLGRSLGSDAVMMRTPEEILGEIAERVSGYGGITPEGIGQDGWQVEEAA